MLDNNTLGLCSALPKPCKLFNGFMHHVDVIQNSSPVAAFIPVGAVLCFNLWDFCDVIQNFMKGLILMN